MTSFLLLALVGLIAQMVDGSLGMAYGATSTSLLLASGSTAVVASASVHLAEVGTTLVSGLSHWRFGNVDRRVLIRIAAPGAVGAFAGAMFLSHVALDAAKPVTSTVLLLLGIYVLTRFANPIPRAVRGRPYVRGRHLALLGGFAGFIDASGGGGWGPIATPTLLATGKLEPRKVIGSVSAAEFAVAAAATLGFFVGVGITGISFETVAGLLVGGAVAAPLAAWVVRWVVPSILGVAVGGLIVLTNARTLLAHWEVAGSGWIQLILLALWVGLVARASVRWKAAKRSLEESPGAPVGSGA